MNSSPTFEEFNGPFLNGSWILYQKYIYKNSPR